MYFQCIEYILLVFIIGENFFKSPWQGSYFYRKICPSDWKGFSKYLERKVACSFLPSYVAQTFHESARQCQCRGSARKITSRPGTLLLIRRSRRKTANNQCHAYNINAKRPQDWVWKCLLNEFTLISIIFVNSNAKLHFYLLSLFDWFFAEKLQS